MVTNSADRNGKVRGKGGRRLCLTPDIGLHEEAVMHHRGAHLFVAGARKEIRHVGMPYLAKEMPHPA